MPGDTSIEWADSSWNPATGCSEVSPGCLGAHCYAKTFAERWRGIEGHPYEQGFDLRLWPERLEIPLRWKRPRTIFVNSMSDLFHEGIPDDFIAQIFATMALADWHEFLALTKRPERMRELLRRTEFIEMVEDHYEDRATSIFSEPLPWPLPNVWLGVSIENRRFVGRADVLRETPAAIRFISAEPLLGPLVEDGGTAGGDGSWGSPCWRTWRDGYEGPGLDLSGIDWLIVGGESGPGHRPMDLQWARDLRDACPADGWRCECGDLNRPHEAFCYRCGAGPPEDGSGRVGTRLFVKQLGGARAGSKLDDLPEDLRIRDMPR